MNFIMLIIVRVKSGKFGRSAKFGQRPCLFHILIIGIKHKLTKQTVKILMRWLIKSHLIWILTVCKCVFEFTRLYPVGILTFIGMINTISENLKARKICFVGV